MRALLLAAGFGTRLRPLTDTVPKCLVPINGEALLGVWLRQLHQADVGPFLINTHYLADLVEQYIAKSIYANQVTLIHEPDLLGTAGTLKANINFFGASDGLLIHADNYCTPDFRTFIQTHQNRPEGCLMTMMTFRTNSPTACGIIELDDRGVVVGFHEKVSHPPGNLANGAVYILSKEFLGTLNAEFPKVSDFSTEILPNFVGRIYTYETQSFFLDIGTPEAYSTANRIGIQAS